MTACSPARRSRLFRAEHLRQCGTGAALGAGARFQLADRRYLGLSHAPRDRRIAHQLPDVALIPFPVVSDRLRIEPWWSNGDTTRLVLSEYLKFLAAKLRMRFDAFVTSE